MIRSYSFFVVIVFVAVSAGCSHTGTCQQTSIAKIPLPSETPRPQDLANVLLMFVDAHRDCRFPNELKNRITFGDRVMGSEYVIDAEWCLGELNLSSFDFSDLFIIPFVFARGDGRKCNPSPGGGRFLVTAVFDGSRWLLYWPEPLSSVGASGASIRGSSQESVHEVG